jgi:hypothetical protein
MHARLPILVALPCLATQTLVGQLTSSSPRPTVPDSGLPTREVFPTLTADATLVPTRSARSAARSQTRKTGGPVCSGTLSHCLLVARPTLRRLPHKATFDLSKQPNHAGLFSRTDGAGTPIRLVATRGAGDIGIALKNQPRQRRYPLETGARLGRSGVS